MYYFLELLPKKKKGNKPLNFIVPPIIGMEYNAKDIANKLTEMLKNINIETIVAQQTESIVLMEIRAITNTWSHQRQKKRKQKINLNSVGDKRKIEEESSDSKRQKVDSFINANNKNCMKENMYNKEIEQCSSNNESGESCSQIYILTGALCVRKEGEALLLELGYLSGSAGKDGIHQIVQYIKNNWR